MFEFESNSYCITIEIIGAWVKAMRTNSITAATSPPEAEALGLSPITLLKQAGAAIGAVVSRSLAGLSHSARGLQPRASEVSHASKSVSLK
jgi:hypothetical protein